MKKLTVQTISDVMRHIAINRHKNLTPEEKEKRDAHLKKIGKAGAKKRWVGKEITP